MTRILVFAATFNEVDNIEDLVQEIFAHLPNQEALIVDDDSPDGTGKLLDRMAADDPRVHVIHRLGKLGLGSAHLLAMHYALRHEYDFLITMDADFSHHPKYLPQIVECLRENDFVIGSRYIKGGHCDYGFIRSTISKTANALTRLMLGIKLHETTTSYASPVGAVVGQRGGSRIATGPRQGRCHGPPPQQSGRPSMFGRRSSAPACPPPVKS